MDRLLAALRAAAEPTRLRLLALAARGAFCVSELTDILGQSQPRLSRHLKLLCDAGLLERVREGANVWFAVAMGEEGALSRHLIARLPGGDPVLEADRRQAARVLAERARVASESFRRQGADWDEMRALGLPAAAVEAALLALLPAAEVGNGRLLDIGTGTGRVLELLGPRVREGLGVDASKAMLALARARLARAEAPHCAVRLGDMYRLPLTDAGFDLAVMQMVLHYAEDPEGVLIEAARVLRPGGRLIVIDLARHDRQDLAARLAHRWPGFEDTAMRRMLAAAGLLPGAAVAIAGEAAVQVRLWPGTRIAGARASRTGDLATQELAI
ncbi:MAG: metalloregulator ArsR/SmtB family transcription factor [Pseudomonadota bacterium]|nr:metalloregulator ArsR/SmtB family transcription factor [Pseudomonadota bacterium]